MTTLAATRPASSQKRVDLWVDVPFTKAPTDSTTGDIELRGYASTFGLDRDEEMVATDAFDKSLSAYLSKNPIILWQHNMDWPIGQVKSGYTDETGLYVVANIPNPGPDAADWQRGAYVAIKSGVVRTFSIGGYMLRDVKAGPDGPVFYIVEVELMEISCVSIPANADSIYEAAVKALKGERPQMAGKAVGQMEQLLGFKELTDPELLSLEGDARAERYSMLSALFERSYGVEAPPMDAWRTIDSARKAGASPINIARATSLLAKAFYAPEPPAEASDQKAGRAISQANRKKLETVLAHHDDIEKHLTSAADAMVAGAKAHADAVNVVKDVLGVSDEEEPDGEAESADGADEDDGKGAEPEVKDAETADGVPIQIDEGPRVDGAKAAAAEAEEEEAIESDEDEDVMLGAADAAIELLAGAQYLRATGMDAKGALSLANLPIAGRDRTWDAGAAKKRVHDWAKGDSDSGSDGGGYDPSKLSKAYLWRDNGAPADQATSYRFIVVDMIDGTLTYVPRGIFAAANVAVGGRGGTQDEIASAIKPALEKLYARLAKKFGDDSIKPPWKGD